MKTLLLLLLLVTAALFADGNYYTASYSAALNGATDALTVQLPSGSNKDVHFIVGWVRCSAACSFSVVINGALATSTTLATTAINNTLPSQATAWSASNVGSGTTVATYNLEAAGTYPFDLTKFFLTKGPGATLTISIATFTGTWRPTIQWSEQ